MKQTAGLTNIQNIPGDTDFDDHPRSQENPVREKDNRQTPPDTVITPISDPLFEKDKKPINEDSGEPKRIMK